MLCLQMGRDVPQVVNASDETSRDNAYYITAFLKEKP